VFSRAVLTAFGTACLALVHIPGQAARGFATVNPGLALTALAAAALAGLSVRRRSPGPP
jgi:hypothetical protein